MRKRSLLQLSLCMLWLPFLWGCHGSGSGGVKPAVRVIPQAETSFRNPIAPSMKPLQTHPYGAPDPYMIYFHGYYYLTYSHTPMVIRRARTIAGLADAEPVTVWPRKGVEEPPGTYKTLWAPEFHRLKSPEDGRFHWYWYYAPGKNGHKTMHVLESAGDDPMGPYHYKARIQVDAVFALDATVFTNHDGRTYYIYSALRMAARDKTQPWPSNQLYLAEMKNPWTLKSKPICISSPTLPWELVGFPINEAPSVLLHGGKIHIIYSASLFSTDSYVLGRLTVPETVDLLSPVTWVNAKVQSPVFKSSPSNGVWSPGHVDFFKSPDDTEDWMVYHAHNFPGAPQALGSSVRTTRAQQFTWDDNGNPVFGEPLPLTEDIHAPSGDSSIAYQFEDAEIQASSHPQHVDIVGDEQGGAPMLVGLRGLRYSAGAPGESIVFRFNVPDRGRYHVYVRVRTEADAGIMKLEVSPGKNALATSLGTRDTYTPKTDARELDFGVVDLSGSDPLFRITVPGKKAESTGFSLTLDQIRLVPVP